VFNFSIGISVFFIFVLLLNLIAPRFWCRYICPLGGLLALLSKISIFRRKVSKDCTSCGICEKVCRLGAIDGSNRSTPEECTVCMDCFAFCAGGHTSYRPAFSVHLSKENGITRREFLFSLAGTAAGVSLLNSELIKPAATNRLIRPPGVIDEESFLSRCIRCSSCMRVCPTGGLQPALFEAGLKSIGTPYLLPRIGHCEYNCNECGKVCPTSAIPKLTLEEKHKKPLGTAGINRSICLPWAHGIPCIVCEEMCPVPEKAIRVTEETVINAYGEETIVQKPRVIPELCIGCGVCENMCPVSGEAAIRVYKEHRTGVF
jgi:MauM/NapG family ferredoxin protein